jgi:glyoxylase-like metal-dependent hydrolase (beta-lactamase superfamily II)
VATSPEPVAPGVYRVDAIRPSNTINVLLLVNDDGWTLVDTGVEGSVSRIRDALAALGSSRKRSPTGRSAARRLRRR